MAHAFHLPVQLGELLDNHALSLQDLARACRRAPDWVSAHVAAGVIEASPADGHTGEWHFTSTTLVRARRIAQLESSFDADPYLAALTTDLMEEVAELRRRVAQLQGGALKKES
ncbi:chaperone modulator CbpM [Simplicispira psychrophila]|uniref:chaperone modulator CbpM n=1 Tax=Simplicispira psychrophila TaxID=80882 RepID=UPI0004832D1D|nr:chaperone modulator CbpM [Simplicispira psychrophila]